MSKTEITTRDKFKVALNSVLGELKTHSTVDGNQWSIKGFIDTYKNVYTLSSDTKLVSKIIEIHLFPKILEFAERHSFKLILSEHQNWYPDMSFISKDDAAIKFALDIKTTFRLNNNPEYCNGFTLGSHGEYFINRSSKKNVQFPYNEYLGHYCLGIIYSRCDSEDIDETRIYEVEELTEKPSLGDKTIGKKKVLIVPTLKAITSVIQNLQFFVAEKW